MCSFLNKEVLEQMKQFVKLCQTKPDILLLPELSFLKEYIESLGGQIPVSKPAEATESKEEPKKEAPKPQEPAGAQEESEEESDLELDTTGCVEPDQLDEAQKMGDPSKEVTEEGMDQADEKRAAAQAAFGEGNFDKAIELYNEAIELNPTSALLFAKRGQAFLKLTKPNACIKDCTKALELNCDSATAYKFRGRAYRLLGEWALAAKDLRQACNIDFDEQTDEWLREVTPNAKKIENHNLKQERRKLEKEEKEKRDRVQKAREAHAKAAQEAADAPPSDEPAGMGDFYKMFQDPELLAAFNDPEISAAFQDILANPANFIKYQSNPKVMEFMSKFSSKFGGAGGAGFPGFMPGFGRAPPPEPSANTIPTFNDDNLD